MLGVIILLKDGVIQVTESLERRHCWNEIVLENNDVWNLFMFPSTTAILPTPAQGMRPQSMMQPFPYLTVGLTNMLENPEALTHSA